MECVHCRHYFEHLFLVASEALDFICFCFGRTGWKKICGAGFLFQRISLLWIMDAFAVLHIFCRKLLLFFLLVVVIVVVVVAIYSQYDFFGLLLHILNLLRLHISFHVCTLPNLFLLLQAFCMVESLSFSHTMVEGKKVALFPRHKFLCVDWGFCFYFVKSTHRLFHYLKSLQRRLNSV